MTKHREILPRLVDVIATADPDCGIMLQGSVAAGCERPTSDFDFYVIVRNADTVAFNRFITPQNQGGMKLVDSRFEGIAVNIGWSGVEGVLRSVEQEGAGGSWMFYCGEIVHDPKGLAKRCWDAMDHWFQKHPRILHAWREQQEEVRRAKAEPAYALRFPTFADFYRHMQEMLNGENNSSA